MGRGLRPVVDHLPYRCRTSLDDATIEFYNYVTGLANGLVSEYHGTIIEQGYAPAIPNRKLKDTKDPSPEEVKDVTGEDVFSVPFWYINLLDQKPLIKSSERLDGETDDAYTARVLQEVDDKFNLKFTSLAEITD